MPMIPPILPFEDEHIHEAPKREPIHIDPARNPGIKVDVDDPITPPVMVTDSKQPWQSKMNIFNAGVLAVGLITIFSDPEVIALFFRDPGMQKWVLAILLLVVSPVVNLILRTFYTGKPTTLTKSS